MLKKRTQGEKNSLKKKQNFYNENTIIDSKKQNKQNKQQPKFKLSVPK